MSIRKRYFHQYLVSWALFLVACILSLLLAIFLPLSPNNSWRYTLAALPMFPAALWVGITLARATALTLNDMDELQRHIQLEAFSFSLAGTATLSFALGWVQWWSEFEINYAFVPLIAGAFWAVGFIRARRKYQ
ncbi:MAG: hypothetical protein GVY30_02370 [Chloroflexi bacterium]|jgi:hypothetical protein|nr:hypothetical protein [Chloroflexota bacterium]